VLAGCAKVLGMPVASLVDAVTSFFEYFSFLYDFVLFFDFVSFMMFRMDDFEINS